jgi:hypothetical protein
MTQVNKAGPKPQRGYVGWELPASDREILLQIIAPLYPDVIAHHVTLKTGVTADYALPTQTFGEVVGVSCDDERVQCLIVKIDGELYRPDFGTFHITWSIDREKGAKPFHSNACIAKHGFKLINPTIPITLVPKFFPQVQN